MSFRTVLVANRGEIAARIIRTCHQLGLNSVAVFSDADADAPHLRMADRAVRLGGAPAVESYLNIDAILEAAQIADADAIHPGYGFLAENEEFAAAVEAAGLVFIGPTPEMIRLMGDKAGARTLMVSHDVPVTPGYSGPDQTDETFQREASRIGYPVLVKAVAGGGGKGMSIVNAESDLSSALATARRLAKAAFNDDTLLLESYIASPRHIEVQILGDGRGDVIHCFERECSIQRRFQKIIEEAPSATIDESMREALCEAAVKAGRALNYRGAGTVEFIASPGGEFYFLEVNTRLQVEHPVTEMITGLDLVAQQIQIAQGQALPEQAQLNCHGHAVEARLYAEDPAHDFRPSTGRLLKFECEPMAHIRLDSGVESGSEVSIHYDPMLAKVIAWGEDREVATRRLVRALRRMSIVGVTTNREFLLDVLEHDEYRGLALSTHFIADHMADWRLTPRAREVRFRCAAAVIYRSMRRVKKQSSVSHRRPGWRLRFRADVLRDEWQSDSSDVTFAVRYNALSATRYQVAIDDEGLSVDVMAAQDDTLSLLIGPDGSERRELRHFKLFDGGDGIHVQDALGQSTLTELPRFPSAGVTGVDSGCVAPMPGKIVALNVQVGSFVESGQTLVVIEAMKMEQALCVSYAGKVTAVHCSLGDVVESDMVLVDVEPSDEAAASDDD